MVIFPPRRCCRAERSLVDPLSRERVHGERGSRLPMVTKLAPEFRGRGRDSRAGVTPRAGGGISFAVPLAMMPKGESLGRGGLSPSLVLGHRSRLHNARQTPPAPSRRWRRLLVTPRVCERTAVRPCARQESKATY